jgi:UDP-N-acetylglucosamine transferase subunit ALG13
LIFVTVGNMDPFDRLIVAIDRWLAQQSVSEDVLAQIGEGTYQPRHCRHVPFLTPKEYRTTFEQARFVVSHAGMGSIITALELQKPIIVMPKRASLNEQRNEHQLATVRHFRKSPLIKVAETEHDLAGVIKDLLTATRTGDGHDGGTAHWPPNAELIDYVRAFVTQTA